MPNNRDIFSYVKQAATALRWLAGLMLVTGCLLARAASVDAVSSETIDINAGRSAIRFNHVTTGFTLTGAHAQANCESCHVQGVFLGTPRECNFCHVSGNQMGAISASSKHIPTTESCANCHRTVAWTPATFRHNRTKPGSCGICHNGTIASGKPNNTHHAQQTICDTCHRTTAWLPASFNHVGVVAGSCVNCHASKKPSNATHVGQTICDTCHRTTGWLPASFSHVGVVAGSCDGCHGVNAIGPSASHINYKAYLLNGASMKCDSCHTTSSWNVNRINHNNSQTGCIGCHLGNDKNGKPVKYTLSHEGVGSDCSQSGCHKPLGSKGIVYINWD